VCLEISRPPKPDGSTAGFLWAKGSHPGTPSSTITPEGTIPLFIPSDWSITVKLVQLLPRAAAVPGVEVVWLQFSLSALLFHVGREWRDGEA
jgi:hypothetical protein